MTDIVGTIIPPPYPPEVQEWADYAKMLECEFVYADGGELVIDCEDTPFAQPSYSRRPNATAAHASATGFGIGLKPLS